MTQTEFRWRSVSQLSTYAKCSESFRLQKFEKAPQSPAAWIAEGNAFHEGIDWWETHGRTHTPAQISEYAECVYWDEVGKLKAEEPDLSKWLKSGMRKPETDIETRLKQVRESVSHYATTVLTEPWKPMELPDGSPASEVPFEIKLSDTLGLRGQIDMVMQWPDGSLRVRDYKTGSKLPGKLQLRVYRLALKEALGLDVLYGDYWLSKKGIIDGPHNLSGARERVVAYFDALNRGIEERVFIPNVGDHCTPCAVKKFCREQGNEPVPERTGVSEAAPLRVEAVPVKEAA